MTRPAVQCSPPLAHLVDACEAECDLGCAEDLRASVAMIDAELVSSIASGPELWSLARSLRDEAERRLARLESERQALSRARRASPARFLAALSWRGANWLDAFREPAVAHEGAE